MSLARLAMPLLALTLLTCASGDASTEGEEAAAAVAVDRGATGEDAEGPKVPTGDAAADGEEVGADPPQGPRKRALIVAIADYSTSEGYADLNSSNDVALVRGALRARGFAEEDIRVVADAEATREGIVRAFEEHLIEAFDPSEPGNVAVFHYSGHGHQITNDNPGTADPELDGFDELLVPYGAPNPGRDRGDYDGELHLRDDEMGRLVGRLRQRVGPEGNVTVFLDACHSGSGTRSGSELPVRGSPVPIGDPAGGTRGAGDDENPNGLSGFDPGSGSATRGGDGEAGLAPFVVISAATQRQLAHETRTDDGTPVGSLSYGVYKALSEVSPDANYGAFFSAIARAMEQRDVPNTPVFEGTIQGDRDRTIFSGELSPQADFIEVDRALEGGRVVIRAGSLSGIQRGAEVAFHRAETHEPGAAAPLATGTVVSATPTDATVELGTGAAATSLEDAWVFVTSYGEDLAVRVRLSDGLPEALREHLLEEDAHNRFFTVVEDADAAHLVVASSRGKAVIRTVEGKGVDSVDVAMLSDEASVRSFGAELVSYAKYRYFRGLDFADPNLRTELEIVPVEQGSFLDTDGYCAPGEGRPIAAERTDEGAFILGPGQHYLVRVRSQGRRVARLAVINLKPGGDVAQLFPSQYHTATEAEIEPGQELFLPACFAAEEAPGQDVLVLLASQESVDYRPLLSATRSNEVGRPPAGGAYKAEAVIEVRR